MFNKTCTDTEILKNNFFENSGNRYEIARVPDTFVDSSCTYFLFRFYFVMKDPCNAFLFMMQYSASCNAHGNSIPILQLCD